MGKAVKWIIGILAALGVLFVIIMMIPDDEDDYDYDSGSSYQSSNNTNVTSHSHSNDNTDYNAGGASYADISSVTVGSDAQSATVMVYINGSDLETNAGEATTDIAEMLRSGVGDNVNVIVQTMGTKEWQDYDISSRTAQTYMVNNGKFELIRDNLGQLDCTSEKTLSEFIGFCKKNYPADRYFFVFWDHGGGPVYGFGYDEWQSEDDSLTLAEMAGAFEDHKDIHFDIIGMDCCIMASMETLYALAPYCKYALLSEDFESGLGWSYTGWMKELENNPGIATPLLGKYIVDEIIKDNEKQHSDDYSSCMGLFNVSTAKSLYEAWKAFAYKNEAALLDANYSTPHMAKGRSFWDLWDYDESDVTLEDYYISDILALVENIDNSSDEAKNLMSALKAAVAYYGHTSDKNELTGLAVSLPYGDSDFYNELTVVYRAIGLDDDYIEWLGNFVYGSDYDHYYDYSGFEDGWDGWGSYEEDYGCNISNGGSCEYSYDYDCDDYTSYCDDDTDGWLYDAEEDIWYCYEDDGLYLYDEDSETVFYYDEDEDEIYYYDEDDDEWYLVED